MGGKGTKVKTLGVVMCINLQAGVHVRGYEFYFAGWLLRAFSLALVVSIILDYGVSCV